MATTDALPATVSASDPMRPEPFAVRHVTKETGDTFTLTLAPGRGRDVPPFQPGQFNMLYVFGVGEVPISISGDPAKPEILVHTSARSGATTRAMQKLQPGDWVGVRGPFGAAWPVEQAHGHDVIFIAGGIGLAPHPARALPRAPPPRPLRARGAALRRPHARGTCCTRRSCGEWRGRFDVGGGRDRGPGHHGVAGLGGGRDQDGPALPLRPPERDGLHLRARGHDPLRRRSPCRGEARPSRASSCPWSGT